MKMLYLVSIIFYYIFFLAGLIDRCCTKDYKIPGTDITLEKGSGVSIAINGLHHDPEYYPEPSQFNPERFSPKNRNKIIPYTFMP